MICTPELEVSEQIAYLKKQKQNILRINLQVLSLVRIHAHYHVKRNNINTLTTKHETARFYYVANNEIMFLWISVNTQRKKARKVFKYKPVFITNYFLGVYECQSSSSVVVCYEKCHFFACMWGEKEIRKV